MAFSIFVLGYDCGLNFMTLQKCSHNVFAHINACLHACEVGSHTDNIISKVKHIYKAGFISLFY